MLQFPLIVQKHAAQVKWEHIGLSGHNFPCQPSSACWDTLLPHMTLNKDRGHTENDCGYIWKLGRDLSVLRPIVLNCIFILQSHLIRADPYDGQ